MSQLVKPIPTRVLLTITTGRLLTKRAGPNDNGIGDLYKALEWLTGEAPFTHQLPRFVKECTPWLLRWFPELSKQNEKLADLDILLEQREPESACDVWLASLGLPESFDVPKIPADDHTQKEALTELAEMVPAERIIVVEKEQLTDRQHDLTPEGAAFLDSIQDEPILSPTPIYAESPAIQAIQSRGRELSEPALVFVLGTLRMKQSEASQVASRYMLNPEQRAHSLGMAEAYERAAHWLALAISGKIDGTEIL